MKKKILSTVLVLVLLCMPMLCLTGCQSDPGNGVVFNVTTTELTLTKGTSFVNSGLKIELNYQLQKWNPETSKYEYVQEDASQTSGYAFKGTTACNYYTKNVTDLSKALSAGMTYSGFDTSTVTAEGATRTMTVTFSGVSHKITYTVTAS